MTKKEQHPAEFTVKSIVLGILLGIIFCIGNAYLGLKIGTTISASIPAAVLSMAILKTFFKKSTVLENNLVQTIASSGEAIAAAGIFTIPALYFLDAIPSFFQIFVLSFLGGILGILFMIPMRRHFIVHEHGKLPYPEGTACAKILQSSSSGSKAFLALIGFVIGIVHKLLSGLFFILKEKISWTIPFLQKTEFSMNCIPSLIGVGFIVGPRVCTLLLVGGALSWWVLIPLITITGVGSPEISSMTANEIWTNYVRYIGAGAMTLGGMMNLFKLSPIIGKTLKTSFSELFNPTSHHLVPRTERDLPLKWLLIGSVLIIFILAVFPGLPITFLTIVLLVILGFFFVAVTSLTVGIVGTTSNPVSGMTITILFVTCIIFVLLGWTERIYLISAITMNLVANVAISLAGTTSQDLKTGFLVGATPKMQQIGEMIGIIIPSIVIGITIYLLNGAYHLGSEELPAPQATMKLLIAKGIMEKSMPVTLFVIGIVIGLALEMLKISIMPVALGIYLPLSLTTSMAVGGAVAAWVRRRDNSEAVQEQGILAASGLIAGDACTGVVIALFAVIGLISTSKPSIFQNMVSLIVYIGIAIILAWITLRNIKKPKFHRRRKTASS